MSDVFRALGGPAVSGSRTPSSPSVFRDIENIAAASSYEGVLAAVIEAQEMAERVLRHAHAEAERIGAEAKKNADQARADARAEGYREGEAKAREEGRAGVAAGVTAVTAALREDMEAFCEAVLAEQARVWGDVEEQLRGFALEIAARVIKAEVTVNPDVVMQITEHALRRLTGHERVRIRVNPDDVERLRGRREELMTLFEGLESVEILADRRVGIGGVQIETDSGALDARIETQMSEINRALED